MNRFRPLSNKILFLSDRPEDVTGLARCARDLASLCATMPDFKVGFLGRGSQGLAKLPWTTYSYPEATGGWGEQYLDGVTKDFFGADHGIVFTNWDVSRLTWFPKPEGRNWDAWLYTPIDGISANGRAMTHECTATLGSFNRVMAASEFGMNVLKASGRPDADWLPHGLFMPPFHPHPDPRPLIGWDKSDIWIGFVAANQARKDFPVAFETVMLLRKHYGNRVKFWLNTNLMIHSWNVYALAADYGLTDCLHVTSNLTDEQMALHYSACDCTMMPSGGEGFSYPTAESFACGTACVVPDYAAVQEIVPEECRVSPVTYRVESTYNVQRAVLSGYGFANAAMNQIEKKRQDPEFRGEELRETVSHLDWSKLKYPWMSWFRAGLR